MAFSIKSLIGKIKGGADEAPAHAEPPPPPAKATHPAPATRTDSKPPERVTPAARPSPQRERPAKPTPPPAAPKSARTKDFLDQLEHRRVNRALAEKVLESLSEVVAQALARGQSAELPEIGTFSLKVYPRRGGTNPKTGTPMTIPETRVVLFRAASELDLQLNSAGAPQEPESALEA